MVGYTNKIAMVLTATVVCLLGMFLLANSVAADITQPKEFYGDISINGVAAPVGTVIVAKIGGVERGSFTTDEVGQYGSSGTFDPRLVVVGEEVDVGQIITFWVNGSQADQTAIYEPGESEEFNITAWVYPLQATDVQITEALNYLSQAQKSNGSIGGFDVDAWVVMAIAAADENPYSWAANVDSVVDYLRNNAGNLDENKATDWERSILAIVAAGENPRDFGDIDYVDILLDFYDGAQIGSNTMLNDDFWGILALTSIGETQGIQNSKNFIISNQNSDGGWGWIVGGASDAENTAAAISALIAAGQSSSSSVITNALNYLKSQQQNNGGFTSEGTTNSAADSWVINAITDAEQSPTASGWRKSGHNPVEHLLSLQDTDGAFKLTDTQRSTPEWMTAYAILALMCKSWPQDTISPAIADLTPSSGTNTTSTSLTISASYSDVTSGIDVSTARLTLDGNNITSSATVTSSGISYASSGLSTGTHSVIVAVSDRKGNQISRSWSFSVVTGSGGSGGGGGGGGGAAGVTSVRDSVTQQGRFTSDVTAISEDRKVELHIPKDTIGKNRVGSFLTSISIKEADDPPHPPKKCNIVGLVYDLGPDGTTIDPPVSLTIEYSESEIPDGVNEENLVVAYWDEEAEEWIELECTVDPDDNTITATVSHFISFTVLAYTRPASFTTTDLEIAPDEIEIGETVTVSAIVTNTGDLTDTYELTIKVNDDEVETKEVEVIGGASEKVGFSIIGDIAGIYNVVIDGLHDSFAVGEKTELPTGQVASESSKAEQPPQQPLPPPAPSKKPMNWPLIGGIGAGVVVIGLFVIVIIRRFTYY